MRHMTMFSAVPRVRSVAEQENIFISQMLDEDLHDRLDTSY